MGNDHSSKIVGGKSKEHLTVSEEQNQIEISQRRLSSFNKLNLLPSTKQCKLKTNRPLSPQHFVDSPDLNEQTCSKFDKRKSGLVSPQPFIKHCTSPNLSRSRRMSLAAVLYEKNYLASEGLINSNGRRHSRTVVGNVPRKLGYNEEVNNTGAECSLAEHLKLSCYQLQILQQSWPRIKSQGALLTVFR
uniref:Uncharacterized protein n=1 Tax=Meloidogyne incognita TaxID=6306 RepID=A0A914KIA1_MELIC